MYQDKKLLASGVLVLTILIVIFLASGISGVKFQPGINIAKESDQTELAPFKIPYISSPIWYYVLMCTIWVALPVSVILFIKYPETRKKTLKGLVYIAIYGFILFLFSRKTQEETPIFEEVDNELIDTTILATQREVAELISTVGKADPNLNIIIDISILILVTFIIVYIFKRYITQPPSTMDQIKAEVEDAINEIDSGSDLRNVIIRCYADMSQILLERRGIKRKQALTPREFEIELQETGLPRGSVQQLTRLFEAVRYGNAQPDLQTENEAINCLISIVEAC